MDHEGEEEMKKSAAATGEEPRDGLCPLRSLLCLGKLWPGSRVLLGMRVCTWLRHELIENAENIVFELTKANFSVDSETVCNDLIRFREPTRRIILQQTGNLSFSQFNKDVLLKGLSRAFATGLQTSLVHLCLRSFGMDAARATTLAEGLGRCTNLTHVDMQANAIGEGTESFFSALAPCTALEHLNVSWSRIGDIGVQHLSMALHGRTSLTYLGLRGCQVGPDGAETVAKLLANLKGLTHLDLSTNAIKSEGLRRMAAVGGDWSAMRHLELGENRIHGMRGGSEPLEPLLRTASQLQHLGLGNNDVLLLGGTEGVAHAIRCTPRLSVLDLSLCVRGSSSLSTLITALGFAGNFLTRLSLRTVFVGPAHADQLARETAHLSLLTDLDLGVNGIEDCGATAIAETLRTGGWESLQALDLVSNDIHDAGAKVLARAVTRQTSLQKLTFGGENFFSLEAWNEGASGASASGACAVYGLPAPAKPKGKKKKR